jgi:hypothetical protein
MNERTKTILIGVAVGASLGAILGWMASANVDYESGEEHGFAKLKPTDYLALGMSMLTFARQFGEMLR